MQEDISRRVRYREALVFAARRADVYGERGAWGKDSVFRPHGHRVYWGVLRQTVFGVGRIETCLERSCRAIVYFV